MVCFCSMPLATVPSNAAKMQFSFTPPKIPLALKVAAALPLLGDAERIDMRLNAEFGNMMLPTISPKAGPLIGLAAQLNLAGKAFTLDDLPTLKMQMMQAAHTLNSHVWPNMKMLASVKMAPLLQLQAIAKLKLDIPPEQFDALLNNHGQTAQHTVATGMALTPPKIKALKLVAGLPPLIGLAENLQIPIGETGAGAKLAARLRGLAGLVPPKLVFDFPKLLKLCAVIDALGTIREAFGEKAMTPVGLRGIAAQLNTLMRVPLPSPMPDLPLAARLDDLPKLENVRLGAQGAKNAQNLMCTPPRIGILPFLNAVVALRASLNDLLGLDPVDYCGGACKAPLPSFA